MSGGQLVVMDRLGRDVKRYSLPDGLATLGSDPACDIRVMLPTVSPHHATVVVHANQTVVRNVSDGETLVNGHAISVAALQHGDTITLGDRSLRWEYSDTSIPRPLRAQPALYVSGRKSRGAGVSARRGSAAGGGVSREPALRLALEMSHRASAPGGGKQVAIVQPQRRDASLQIDTNPRLVIKPHRPYSQTNRRSRSLLESTMPVETEAETSKRKGSTAHTSPRNILDNYQNTTKATLWIESRKSSPRMNTKVQTPKKVGYTPKKKNTPLRMAVLKKGLNASMQQSKGLTPNVREVSKILTPSATTTSRRLTASLKKTTKDLTPVDKRTPRRVTPSVNLSSSVRGTPKRLTHSVMETLDSVHSSAADTSKRMTRNAGASPKKQSPNKTRTPARVTSAQKPKVTKIEAPTEIDHTKQAALRLMAGHSPKSRLPVPTRGGKTSPRLVIKKPSPVKKTPQSSKKSVASRSRGNTPRVTTSAVARRSSNRGSKGVILGVSGSSGISHIGENITISRESGEKSPKSPLPPSPKKSALKDPRAKRNSKKTESIKFDFSNLEEQTPGVMMDTYTSHIQSFQISDDERSGSDATQMEDSMSLYYSDTPSVKSPSPRKSIHSRSSKILEKTLGASLSESSPAKRNSFTRTLTPESPKVSKTSRGSLMIQRALDSRTTKSLSDSENATATSTFKSRTLSLRQKPSDMETYSIVDLVSVESNQTGRSGSVYDSAGSANNSIVTYGTPEIHSKRSTRSSIGSTVLASSTPYVGKMRSSKCRNTSSEKSSLVSNISTARKSKSFEGTMRNSSRRSRSSSSRPSSTLSRRSKSLTAVDGSKEHITVNSTRLSSALKNNSPKTNISRHSRSTLAQGDVSDSSTITKTPSRLSKSLRTGNRATMSVEGSVQSIGSTYNESDVYVDINSTTSSIKGLVNKSTSTRRSSNKTTRRSKSKSNINDTLSFVEETELPTNNKSSRNLTNLSKVTKTPDRQSKTSRASSRLKMSLESFAQSVDSAVNGSDIPNNSATRSHKSSVSKSTSNESYSSTGNKTLRKSKSKPEIKDKIEDDMSFSEETILSTNTSDKSQHGFQISSQRISNRSKKSFETSVQNVDSTLSEFNLSVDANTNENDKNISKKTLPSERYSSTNKTKRDSKRKSKNNNTDLSSAEVNELFINISAARQSRNNKTNISTVQNKRNSVRSNNSQSSPSLLTLQNKTVTSDSELSPSRTRSSIGSYNSQSRSIAKSQGSISRNSALHSSPRISKAAARESQSPFNINDSTVSIASSLDSEVTTHTLASLVQGDKTALKKTRGHRSLPAARNITTNVSENANKTYSPSFQTKRFVGRGSRSNLSRLSINKRGSRGSRSRINVSALVLISPNDLSEISIKRSSMTNSSMVSRSQGDMEQISPTSRRRSINKSRSSKTSLFKTSSNITAAESSPLIGNKRDSRVKRFQDSSSKLSPSHNEGVITPENRNSTEEPQTPVLSIKSLLDSSQNLMQSPSTSKRSLRDSVVGSKRGNRTTKSTYSVRKLTLRASKDSSIGSEKTDDGANKPDPNEENITPKSSIKPVQEAVKNKHSTAKKPQSKRLIIDNLNDSDIIKQLFNSPVKRKLSQSMTEFSKKHMFDDDDLPSKKRTRNTIALTGRTPNDTILDNTSSSYTPEAFVSPLSTPTNSPNISGIKRLFRNNSPKNDLTNVAGVKNLLKTPRARNAPKDDLTNVSGIKLVFANSPKNRLSDVRGVKNVFAASPKNDLRRVTGVKALFQTQSKKGKPPKNDLSDVRGVRSLFRENNSPKNDLTNISGVKSMMQANSPKNNLSDLRGLRNIFKTNEHKDSLSDVSGVEELFNESHDIRKDLSSSEALFDRLLGKPPIRAAYSKSFIKKTPFKKPRKTKSLHVPIEMLTDHVEEWLREELNKQLHKDSGDRNKSKITPKVSRELRKLATATVAGNTPIVSPKTRNASILKIAVTPERKKSLVEEYGIHRVPIKKRSLVDVSKNNDSKIKQLPIKKRALVHSTPLKGKFSVTANASELGRVSPISLEDRTQEVVADNSVRSSGTKVLTAKSTRSKSAKNTAKTVANMKKSVITNLMAASPKQLRPKNRTSDSSTAQSQAGHVTRKSMTKKRKSSVVILKKNPITKKGKKTTQEKLSSPKIPQSRPKRGLRNEQVKESNVETVVSEKLDKPMSNSKKTLVAKVTPNKKRAKTSRAIKSSPKNDLDVQPELSRQVNKRKKAESIIVVEPKKTRGTKVVVSTEPILDIQVEEEQRGRKGRNTAQKINTLTNIQTEVAEGSKIKEKRTNNVKKVTSKILKVKSPEINNTRRKKVSEIVIEEVKDRRIRGKKAQVSGIDTSKIAVTIKKNANQRTLKVAPEANYIDTKSSDNKTKRKQRGKNNESANKNNLSVTETVQVTRRGRRTVGNVEVPTETAKLKKHTVEEKRHQESKTTGKKSKQSNVLPSPRGKRLRNSQKVNKPAEEIKATAAKRGQKTLAYTKSPATEKVVRGKKRKLSPADTPEFSKTRDVGVRGRKRKAVELLEPMDVDVKPKRGRRMMPVPENTEGKRKKESALMKKDNESLKKSTATKSGPTQSSTEIKSIRGRKTVAPIPTTESAPPPTTRKRATVPASPLKGARSRPRRQ